MKLQSVCFKKWWIGVVCCLSFAGPALRVNRPHAGDNQFWLTGPCTLLRCGLCTENTHVRRLLWHICVWGSCVVLFHFFFFFLFYLRKKNLISWCVWWCVLHWRAGWLFWWNFLSHFFLKTHLTNSQTSLWLYHHIHCNYCLIIYKRSRDVINVHTDSKETTSLYLTDGFLLYNSGWGLHISQITVFLQCFRWAIT